MKNNLNLTLNKPPPPPPPQKKRNKQWATKYPFKSPYPQDSHFFLKTPKIPKFEILSQKKAMPMYRDGENVRVPTRGHSSNLCDSVNIRI